MTEICRNIEKTIVSLPFINGYTEFFKYKIFGDGKCGYHAISVWLKKNRPAQYDAILAALPNPKPKYPILGYLQDYLKNLGRDATQQKNVMNQCGFTMRQMNEASKRVENNYWMETAELSIICCLLGVMAYVYDDTNPIDFQWTNIDPRNVEQTQKKENIIYLYNQKKTHFDLLEPVGYDEEIKRKQRMTSPRPERELTPERPPRSQSKFRWRRPLSKSRKPRNDKKDDNKNPQQKGSTVCEGCAVQLQSTPNSLKF